MSADADVPIPAWAWALLEPYVDRRLESRGRSAPTPRVVLAEVAALWPALSCTLLVQEPWQGTIRFKRLARLQADAMRPFLAAPERYLAERFGGGKFKVNFHDGLSFITTKNFKLGGAPRWAALPEVEAE